MRKKKYPSWEKPNEALITFKPPEPAQSGVDWRLTLADLLALLITFFTMLFAMSDFDMDKFAKLAQTKERTAPIEQKTLLPGESLSYLSAIIENKISEDKTLSGLKPVMENNRLILSLPVEETAKLNRIAGLFTHLPNQLVIVTHIPLGSSEWEKGLKKVALVQEIFTSQGYDKPITVKTSASDSENNEVLLKIDVIVLPLQEP